MTLQPSRAILFRVAFAGLALSMSAACGRGEPSTDAERLARGRELVQQMSDKLGGATRLSVTTTESRDVVRLSGAKETVTGDGEYILQRPDHFHTRTAAGRNLESWYNGKVLTLAAHNEKVFGQAPMPENINRTLDALAERYDMAMPMGDLFYAPAIKALISDTATGGYAGTEDVGGTSCYHLAFKDIGADFELWLPTQGDPLPKRFKVVQKKRTGQPVIDVTFKEWNLAPQTSDATFKPKLPADYEGIAMVQRAAAIKNTADSTAPAQK